VHVNRNFRSKFNDKAIHGYLVGYVNNRNGFRVWIPSKKKIVLSHDVKFKPKVVCNMRTNVVELEGTCEETLRQSQPNPTPDVNHDKRIKEEFDTASSFGGNEERVEEEVQEKRERKKSS